VAEGRGGRPRLGGLMNLLRNLRDARVGEITETILAAPEVRIERIVSHGQASPEGFWYDQPEAEWVLLLTGAAELRFEDEPRARVLGPGDCVHIAAHRRHRVEWTDPDRPTIWLAVFHSNGDSDQNRPPENKASRNARST
jgi:cupin 2 domain-containing protein